MRILRCEWRTGKQWAECFFVFFSRSFTQEESSGKYHSEPAPLVSSDSLDLRSDTTTEARNRIVRGQKKKSLNGKNSLNFPFVHISHFLTTLSPYESQKHINPALTTFVKSWKMSYLSRRCPKVPRELSFSQQWDFCAVPVELTYENRERKNCWVYTAGLCTFLMHTHISTTQQSFGKNCQKLTGVCSVLRRFGLRVNKCSIRKTNSVFTLSDVSLSTKYRVCVCNCVKVLSNSFCLIAHS